MYCKLEEKQIGRIIKHYGSPLYVFHADEFVENYTKLLNSMRSIYSKYNIAYSYKTNYTPKICKLVKKLGGLAEVVSEMEYSLAQKNGYTSKDIVFNGPVKGNALFVHLSHGGIANIDSIDEMETVVEFASKHPDLSIRLAFRVNINIGQGYISRFGIDAYEENKDNTELDTVFSLARGQLNIEVVGLHCHIGRSRSVTAWENRIRIMFKLVDHYFDKVPEFINLGSGMNSVMEPVLSEQFGGHIPTFDEYASVIASSMEEKYGHLPDHEKPTLLTEPGTTLISGCMSFIGSVKTIKNVKDKCYVTFDCSGNNLGDICSLKQLPISIKHNGGKLKNLTNATFVGYTCLEHDHIYKNFNGDLAVGDFVQFRNVGSYSNVFKPPFILPNCAMIQIDKNGNTELIKRTETIDDIFNTYVF